MANNAEIDSLRELWLKDIEVAAVLGLATQTLRKWRMLDLREGRGTPDRPGRGGLIYRRFSKAVRYYAPSLAPQPPAAPEAVDAQR